MRNVLFYRDFRQFTGGHLKVWHYFNHVLSVPGHDAWVRFSTRSVWDETNPWVGCRSRVLASSSRLEPDVLFLAGLDWLNLTRRERRRPRRAVVNLVQHVRHADPTDPRFPFLEHPAVRICVSTEVAEAIVSTGRVNGPVLTIPNAIDVGTEEPPRPAEHRDLDLLVVATKQPTMGRVLAERLARGGRRTQVIDGLLPRDQFLEHLRRARATLFLPNPREGFYLPALEGMALGTLVVCPDCVGNRSFCLHDLNCLRPAFDEEEMVAAAEAALDRAPAARARMLEHAAATAAAHDLSRERAAFGEILKDVERLQPH